VRQDDIKIRVGVVYTTEQEDWSAVRDWHIESSECPHRKFIDSATIIPMGLGRFVVFSTDFTRERLGHNIRSALCPHASACPLCPNTAPPPTTCSPSLSPTPSSRGKKQQETKRRRRREKK
jgi:hypothetical protein